MTDTTSYGAPNEPEAAPEIEATEGLEPAEDPTPETPEVEADEPGEGEPTTEPEDQAAPGEDPIAALRAELEQLRPYADLGRRVAEGQVRQQQQQEREPAGPDPRTERLVHDALRILRTEADDERREKAFRALPAEVQHEAARRAQAADEDEIQRIADPDGWVERRIAPVLKRLLAPLAQRMAMSEFEKGYPDLVDEESQAALKPLLAGNVPLPIAAKVVRAMRSAQPAAPGKVKETPENETARVVREARRRTSTRQPERAPVTKAPKLQGVYFEDVARELEALGEE